MDNVKCTLLLLFLWVSPYILVAQSKLTKYTIGDGLPSQGAYFLYEDFDGYIWVCTDKGIARYNGYEFEIFTPENGLTGTTFFGVYEDNKHNLYFTSFNGSITCYNYKSKEIIPFWGNKELKTKLKKGERISFIGFDSDNMYLHPIGRNQREYACRFKISLTDSTLSVDTITKKKAVQI